MDDIKYLVLKLRFNIMLEYMQTKMRQCNLMCDSEIKYLVFYLFISDIHNKITEM